MWTTTTKSPFYNPNNPSYNGGGSYYGNRYGDDDYSGSSFNIRTTTKRPSSSSSSGGFLSGLSNFLSGDVGKLISSAISSRGGSGGSGGGGGFGSFFDTRPLTENKNYRGGLFSENTNQGATRTTNDYTASRYGELPSAPTSRPAASHGSYGWNLS